MRDIILFSYLRELRVQFLRSTSHPNQSGSDWSHFIFTSKIPVLYNLNLAGKNFNNASFVNGGLYHTHFENTKFIHAKMKNSHFEHCVFKKCDLRNADLKDAHLEYTLFRDTSLRGANLAGADLERVTFWNVDLRGANLTGARVVLNWFYKSDLRGANLKWGKTGGILYDSQTKWPKGFNLKNDMFMPTDGPPQLGGR